MRKVRGITKSRSSKLDRGFQRLSGPFYRARLSLRMVSGSLFNLSLFTPEPNREREREREIKREKLITKSNIDKQLTYALARDFEPCQNNGWKHISILETSRNNPFQHIAVKTVRRACFRELLTVRRKRTTNLSADTFVHTCANTLHTVERHVKYFERCELLIIQFIRKSTSARQSCFCKYRNREIQRATKPPREWYNRSAILDRAGNGAVTAAPQCSTGFRY